MLVELDRESINTTSALAVVNGRLSKYPLGAVTGSRECHLLGIDICSPAFYRVGFNGLSSELFIAFDIGLNVNNYWLNTKQESLPLGSSSKESIMINGINFFFGFNVLLDDFFF